MKSLFKVTLLATTMAVALHAPITFAAEAAKPATTADSKAAFKNDDQKSAYALGASLGRYMENSLKEQEKLGIKLDKDQLIAGVQDAFADKYSAAIFLIPICISFDTAEKRRYATYLILNRRFSFEF